MAKVLSGDHSLNEAGATYNKKNRSALLNAYQSLRTALAELLAGDMLDGETDDSEEKPAKNASKDKEQREAATWSLSDTASALGRELSEKIPNAYILDIFPQENLIVYQVGWRGGYYQASYSVDETGVATFGDPVEVSRKVSYVPTSDNDPAPAMSMPVDESATVEIETDTVQLVERAVNDNGEVMLKLISPGIGSSGYYSAEVLKRDGPRVFVKGTHNLIDHPTVAEESARPEGSISNLGSTLTENAQWYDSWRDKDGNDHGAGLYAKAKVKSSFREDLNVIAPDIGVSIRARGKAHMGTVDGKSMPIVDTIEAVKSVDYVTLPGRGGKVIELAESKRASATITEVDPMPVDEKQFEELRESNKTLLGLVETLRAQINTQNAATIIDSALHSYPTLPAQARARVRASVAALALPLNESGAVDGVKLVESVQSAVVAETTYLAQLGVGQVVGLGASLPANNLAESRAALEKSIADNLAAL